MSYYTVLSARCMLPPYAASFRARFDMDSRMILPREFLRRDIKHDFDDALRAPRHAEAEMLPQFHYQRLG